MLEHERTFLAKSVPEAVLRSPSKEILDIFVPTHAHHPQLRLRRDGDRHEITKKVPSGEDKRIMHEHTTPLTKEEFEELAHGVAGKRARKTRYYYKLDGHTWEFNAYHDALEGLVVIEVEFATPEEMDAMTLPDFVLCDVSQEEFVAGGSLAGKSYADIAPMLGRFGYQRL